MALLVVVCALPASGGGRSILVMCVDLLTSVASLTCKVKSIAVAALDGFERVVDSDRRKMRASGPVASRDVADDHNFAWACLAAIRFSVVVTGLRAFVSRA